MIRIRLRSCTFIQCTRIRSSNTGDDRSTTGDMEVIFSAIARVPAHDIRARPLVPKTKCRVKYTFQFSLIVFIPH